MPYRKRLFTIEHFAATILPRLPEKVIYRMGVPMRLISKRQQINLLVRPVAAAHPYWVSVTLGLLAALFMPRSDARSPAPVVDFSTYKVVNLVYGVNAVRFGPAGTQGTVLLGWRENFNAHGFGVATFYLTTPKDAASGFQRFGLVSIWDDVKDSREALSITTSGGADCVLHDFRLLISSQQKPALLVLADRTTGETFVDEETVTFKMYTLEQNMARTPGLPTFYFALTEQRVANRTYCDVEKAFQDDLGLGDYQDRLK
jgi:hypothetical protein